MVDPHFGATSVIASHTMESIMPPRGERVVVVGRMKDVSRNKLEFLYARSRDKGGCWTEDANRALIYTDPEGLDAANEDAEFWNATAYWTNRVRHSDGVHWIVGSTFTAM